MDTQQEDQIIAHFLSALGPWRDRIVIGGGYAPIIYKLYFADSKLSVLPVGTRDIDSLVPRRLPISSEKSTADHLKDAGFTRKYKDYDNPPTERYVKDIQGIEVEVEFLTSNATRHNKVQNVYVAGIVAQPLRYLNLSLKETLPFSTHSGESGHVVAPAAWAFHRG